MERYFLGEDPDFGYNRYLVPVSRRADWDRWCGLPGDSPECDVTPDYARRIDDVELLTFTDPQVI